MSPSLFAWPLAVYRADFRSIYNANGMDAYFYVRFLRFMAIIFLPIWIVTWGVLIPLTSVNSYIPGNSGLDKFAFGNVEPSLKVRYTAHVVVAYAITSASSFLSLAPPCISINIGSSLGVL